MTAHYHISDEELNLELLRELQKPFEGKKVMIDINIRTLDEPELHENLDEWRKQFFKDSAFHLNNDYGENEPDYSKSDLISVNPTFNPI